MYGSDAWLWFVAGAVRLIDSMAGEIAMQLRCLQLALVSLQLVGNRGRPDFWVAQMDFLKFRVYSWLKVSLQSGRVAPGCICKSGMLWKTGQQAMFNVVVCTCSNTQFGLSRRFILTLFWKGMILARCGLYLYSNTVSYLLNG